MSNFSGDDITIYPATASGNFPPAAILGGFNTGIGSPQSVTLDKLGKAYVVNGASPASVTVYATGAHGNAAPAATISGANTLLDMPIGSAVDAKGRILVTNLSSFGPAFDSVLAFNAGATGNVAPAVIISGSNTGLDTPFDVKLDASGRIYVANFGADNVPIFAATANGNVAPVAVIAGPATGLRGPNALALDASGRLYVANDLATITVYAAGASGNAAPIRTIAGANTTLFEPLGIALDSNQRIYIADANDRVVVFPAGANGNLAPAAIIAGPSTLLDGVDGVALIPAPPAPTVTPTVVPSATRTPTRTATRTPVPTATRTPKPTATPKPTPTPVPGTPFISSVPRAIVVGAAFNIAGANFTPGSVVNFFVATSAGPVNAGPLVPTTHTPALLTVNVPLTTILGQGFVAVQVVNTDKKFLSSNLASALLQGSAAAGIPTITSINGVGLAATSSDPRYATNNVEAVVVQGTVVTLGGMGFDTSHGAAVDLFCACTGGKVGPFFLLPGNPGLGGTSLRFTLPSSGPNAPTTGPGSFVVSNAGPAKTFTTKSNAVSVPIGARITVTSITQAGSVITVNGTGFSIRSVINLFNTQPAGVVNLGGFGPGGVPNIPLTFVNSTRFSFNRPTAAFPGASYVQAFNPPFVPFTSSGNDPRGAFTLK